jgi:predicted type IV restriction endonuclease
VNEKPCAVCALPFDLAVGVTRALLSGESPRSVSARLKGVSRKQLRRHITVCYARYQKRESSRRGGAFCKSRLERTVRPSPTTTAVPGVLYPAPGTLPHGRVVG